MWAPTLNDRFHCGEGLAVVIYKKVARIDGGGQGEVWRATGDDGSTVAIKFMHLAGSQAEQDEDRRRFKREITCQSSLSHTGIMPVLGSNLAATPPFMIMPVADESLRDVLVRTGGGLPENDAVRMFEKILEAVAYSHSEGVIHRDLKPENVLVLSGEPVLSDFGLGRRLFSGSTVLTTKGVGWGSHGYSAPEQFSDLHSVDASADVYALGCILYEMFTGQPAAMGVDLTLVPASYRYVIMTATQKVPAKRFASASEMLREISILTNGSEALLAPGDKARELIQQIAAGDGTNAQELVRVLIDNSEDVQLYMTVFVQTPETVLAELARTHTGEYKEIIRIFDGYADGGHPFSFTDTLASFLRAVFNSSSDVEVHTIVIERLLNLGYQHNRWYVRNVFVEVLTVALRQPMYAPIVAGILRDNPESHEFVREPLQRISLPRIVVEALAA